MSDTEDEEILKNIIADAESVSYQGSTEVKEYRHRYSVKGRVPNINVPENSLQELDLGEDKAECQSAGSYRWVLRTTAPLEELLRDGKNYDIL